MPSSLLRSPASCVLCIVFALITAPRLSAQNNVARLTGDGTTDVTSIVQEMVDSGTGNIFLPRGVHRITKTITVDLDQTGPTSFMGLGTATLLMEGPGPAIHYVGTHEGTAAPHTFKDNVWKNQRSPMVDGVEIVGAHDEACGIEATGTMQLTVTRTVIRKVLHGVHLTKRNRNVIISSCHIYENNGVGVFYDDVSLHQSNIIGSHISYNKQGGIVSRAGDVRNIHIGTCDIEGNMGGPESEPTANVLLDSTGGSVAEVAIVGCTIQHEHPSPNSANIRINGDSTPRPFTDETRHGFITIADNVLSDVQVNIDVANARGVSITGNTIWKGYTHNLKVTNSESLTVSGNVFDRNPRYHYGDGADSINDVVFEKCKAVQFTGNVLNGAGIDRPSVSITGSEGFNITDNSIFDAPACGIELKNVSNSRVSGSIIRLRKDTKGPSISLTNCKDLIVSDNLLETPVQHDKSTQTLSDNVIVN